MRLRNTWIWMGALLVGLAALAGTASATTLADVAPTDTFVSGNGKLQFSDFQFLSACGSCVQPGDITLEILADGIQLSGPLSNSGSGFKAFQVSYSVLALDPSMPITDASLELDATAEGGPFAEVYASKRITGASDSSGWYLPALAKLETWERSRRVVCPPGVPYPCYQSSSNPFDSTEFDTSQSEIQVTDTVHLVDCGGDTTWNSSANHFSTGSIPVPEPSTAAIFALGLVGLGLASGRRR